MYRVATPAAVMRAGAVATSGSAQRGAHIIDPHHHRAATASQAVTVFGPTLLWADVYATAAAARGTAAIPWLNDLDGYEALMVTTNGILHTTAAWPSSDPWRDQPRLASHLTEPLLD